MNLFHKIVYKTIPVNIPDYLTLYSGDSRLRRTHLDNLSFVSNIATTTTSINNLNKSFFFRTDARIVVYNVYQYIMELFTIWYKKFNETNAI